MGDPVTLTLNMTFLGTLVIGLIMFLVMFLMFAITLLLAGAGKLVAVIVMALVGIFSGRKPANVPEASQANPADTPADADHHRMPRTEKHKPAALAEDWASAVAAADARAAERENRVQDGSSSTAPSGLPVTKKPVPGEQRKAS